MCKVLLPTDACWHRARSSSRTDLVKRDSESSSISDDSNCSLASLMGASQVAFIRRSKATPFRAVSLPEELPYHDDRCASPPACARCL